MKRKPREFVNLDANEGIFFENELESVKANSYDVLYPELLARRMIPVDSSADTGAESISYRTWDHVGMARLLNSYADNLPNVNVTAKKTTREIYGEGVAFGYSLQDIRNARYANKPLEQRQANAARRQILQLENKIAWHGNDSTKGVPGIDIPPFINNSNINAVTPVDGTAGTTDWASKTPDEIINDVTLMVTAIRDISNGIESPSRLMLPEAQYTLISTKPRSSTSDTTILNFILGSNAWITEIVPNYELKDAAPVSASYDSEDCAILYDPSPDKLTLEIPQDVEFLPVQEQSLMYQIPVHARTAGTIIYYPKSIAQLNGI